MGTTWISQLNLVDLVAIIYLLYGMVRGFMRGLSGELARLISMGVVFVLGWQFYDVVGEKLMEFTRLEEAAARLTGFLLILAGAGIGTVLVRWILRNLVEFTFKEPLEKIGGVVAGFLRCGAWMVLAMIAASLSPSEHLNRKFGEESQMGSLVSRYLIPAYQQLAEDRPELGLPAIPEDEPPLSTDGEEASGEPDPRREPADEE